MVSCQNKDERLVCLMQYVLLFLEGFITFISPCLLPLLPVYISYFSGDGGSRSRPVVNSVSFVIGFTVIFVALGAFAGTVGSFLLEFSTAINLITGAIVVLFGLNYLGVLRLGFAPHAGKTIRVRNGKPLNMVSAFVFGVIFSVAWMPCVSKFLGAALMRAASQGSVAEGMFMLFVFSMGLGIPFIISAVLIHRLKDAFDFLKRHQRVVNLISGGMLVVVGILMMTGLFTRFVALF